MQKKRTEPFTVGELQRLLDNCDPNAVIKFAGWQCVHTLTVCETWRSSEGAVITFEEIN
jgi:hypothetical protein